MYTVTTYTVCMTTKIIGYHGTRLDVVSNIRKDNFLESEAPKNSRYGKGVYFFVEGLNDPIKESWKWTEILDYHSKAKDLEYVVLEVDVFFEKEHFFDLTISENLQVFNKLKDALVERARKGDFNGNELKIKASDHAVFEWLKLKRDIEVLKVGIIASSVIQIKERIPSNVQNAIILVVNNPKDHIDIQTLKVVKSNVSCSVK